MFFAENCKIISINMLSAFHTRENALWPTTRELHVCRLIYTTFFDICKSIMLSWQRRLSDNVLVKKV